MAAVKSHVMDWRDKRETNALVPSEPLRYSGHNSVPWEVAGTILSFIPENANVLDVGCGTGALSILMQQEKGAEVVGIEPNAERARAARTAGCVVHCCPFRPDLDDLAETFEVVVFADVLEHLADPLGALVDARKYLVPDGMVVASVPNVAHWSVRWDLVWGRFDYEHWGIMDSTHLRWFTEKTVKSMFRDAGFEILQYAVTAGTTLPPYSAKAPWKWIRRDLRQRLIRMLASRLPNLFGGQHVIAAKCITES